MKKKQKGQTDGEKKQRFASYSQEWARGKNKAEKSCKDKWGGTCSKGHEGQGSQRIVDWVRGMNEPAVLNQNKPPKRIVGS